MTSGRNQGIVTPARRRSLRRSKAKQKFKMKHMHRLHMSDMRSLALRAMKLAEEIDRASHKADVSHSLTVEASRSVIDSVQREAICREVRREAGDQEDLDSMFAALMDYEEKRKKKRKKDNAPSNKKKKKERKRPLLEEGSDVD